MLRRVLQSLQRFTRPAWAWPLIVFAAAWVPVSGALSTTRIFHVRDLGLFFWPRHVWLRRSLLEGQSAFWDPYAGAGQSAAADALNHLFFPAAVVLRLLPDVVGFNLWIALPFPVAALGAYYLLRKRVSLPAAALGALVFVASGPVVSSGNFPNFSWAVALMPWVVWSADRLAASRGRIAAVAVLVGLQALAGEPVTLIATAVLAAGWVWTGDQRQVLPARCRQLAMFGVGCAVGGLIAAVQLLPLAAAAARSRRVQLAEPGMWSLHPLALVETMVPNVFGDTLETTHDGLPWVPPLNSDREPLLLCLYIGVAAFVMAIQAISTRSAQDRRWIGFWCSASAVALVASLGSYTPLYPAAQAIVPVLDNLRFPVKYLVVVALAIAVLAASGWDALRRKSEMQTSAARRAPVVFAVGVATLAAVVALFVLYASGTAHELFARLGVAVGVDDPSAAGVFLVRNAPPLLGRLLLLAGSTAVLVRVVDTRRAESRLAVAVLFALVLIDPLTVNARVHPTMPASLLGAPAWTAALEGASERVYVGGKVIVPGTRVRLDTVERGIGDINHTSLEMRALLMQPYLLTPAAWKVREVVSYDLPQLWPREYHSMLRLLGRVDWEARLRFLALAGVRFCLLPEPPFPEAPSIAEVDVLPGKVLYECAPGRPRAIVVPHARIVSDFDRQLATLLRDDFDPDLTVLLQTAVAPVQVATIAAATPAADGPPPPGRSSAQIVTDDPTRIVVHARVDEAGGFLTLLDSYDPDWAVRVNGTPAILLRANALFRAVQLGPGDHVVEFRYRPTALYVGGVISALAVLGLCVPWPRRLTSSGGGV